MNTYTKFCPNTFVAKCTETHEKGDLITLTTRYGQEHENEVFNYLGKTKDGFYLYSIIRTDGINAQQRAKNKAERLSGCALNAEKRSDKYYQASKEGRDFLILGEPIKVGHHSERRHRKLIERNWERMGRSVAESDKAKEYERRSEYWKERANKIDLSMPDSLEFFEFELDKAKKHHQHLKDNPNARHHSMSLQYANKAVKDLEEKVVLAIRLWGDADDIKQLESEQKEREETKAKKNNKSNEVINKYGGFFAFNTEQFKEGIAKIREKGLLEDGEKVTHIKYNLYIPSKFVDAFLKEYK